MTNSPLEVRTAAIADLDSVTPLFDAYRQFYRLASDMEGARHFLRNRLERDESVVFVAFAGAVAVGFTQLYASYSSAAMARIFILNDLFVVPEARGRGVGTALLQSAAEYGRKAGAVRLTLSTEVTNVEAQALYAKSGWTRDEQFCVYRLALSG